MSLMKTNVEAFCPLLEGEIRDLPELVFDDSIANMSSAIAQLGDILEDELASEEVQEVPVTGADDAEGGEDDEEAAAMITNKVIRAYSRLKQNPKYAANFTPIYTCAAALGANVAKTFSILRDKVKPKTLALKDRINNRVMQDMEKQGISFADLSYKPNFKVLNWNDYYKIMGGWEAIQTAMTSALGYEPLPTAASLRSLLYKLELDLETLPLDEEAKEDITKRTSTDATEEQKEVIEEALEVATDRYTFNKLLAETAQAAVDSTNLMPVLKRCEHVLFKLYPTFSKMRHTEFNLAGPVHDTLQKNFKKVDNALLAIAYTVGVIDNYYKDSYVMNEDTVNGDNQKQDADEAKSQQEQAMRYLHTHYFSRDVKLPSAGISMKEIEEDQEQTEQMYAALLEDNKKNARKITSHFVQMATEEELTDYLEEMTPEELPPDTTPEEMKHLSRNKVNSAIYQLEGGAVNLESVLYNFIIDTHYPLPAVQKAHALFGPEVVRQMELNNELTEDTLKLVDTSVGADLVTECIVQNFMVRK